MSWSVYATGKPKAVAASLDSQFASSKCAEPEESVRMAAQAALKAAVAAQREDSVVRVSASGSQSSTYNENTKAWGAPYTNSLTMQVENLCVLTD